MQKLMGRVRPLAPVIATAFALAFVLFWYTPAFLYTSNLRQFYFPLLQTLPLLAVPLIFTIVVLVVPSIFMPERARRFYAAILGSLVAFLFVQGFLLPRNYGLLDGAVELPSFSPLRLVVSIAIVVVVAALVAFGPVRASRFLGVLAAIVVVLVAHFLVLVLRDPKPVRAFEPARIDSLYALGDENLLVVLLDALQSDVFAEVVEARPELVEALDGFTYYPNTMGVAPTTYGSLPTIHSSRLRTPGKSMEEHFNTSIGQDSFLTELADAGWKATLLNPTGGICPARIGCFPYDASFRSSTRVRLVQQAAELLDVSLFRLAPPELKAAVYNANRWRVVGVFQGRSYAEAGDLALRDLSKNFRRGTGKSVKFLHLHATHAPATRRADCSLLEVPSRMTRSAARDQANCAFTRVGALITKLQRMEVYDETSIVLLADTGYRLMGSERVADEDWTQLIGNANPLFAVKPPDARGPMRTSDDELSLTDLGPIICSMTKHCDDANWERPDADRPREFLFYEWHDEFWHAATLLNERRYEVRGSMFDPSSWKDLGKDSTVPKVSTLTFGLSDRPEHFGLGWGPIQGEEGNDSRWVLGPRASLYLRLPADADSRIELDVGALPEHPDQSFYVNVNGRTLRLLRVKGSDETVSFRVPRRFARSDVDHIRMRFSYVRSGGSDPDRHKRRLESLAVRFDELRVMRDER